MNALRFFILGNMLAVLCFTVTAPVFAQEKINLFDRKNKKSEERIKRTVKTDLERKIFEALQSVGNAEEQNHSQAIWHYGVFFVGLAVIIAGLVYWQVWMRKKANWVLNDPMALVQELNAVHLLSDQEKQFMHELSERQGLSSSLKLFVEPKFLLESWNNESAASSRPTVQSLLLKLFNITMDDPRTTVLTSKADADTTFFPAHGTHM